MSIKIMFARTQSAQLNVNYIKSGIFLQNSIPLCCMKQEDEVENFPIKYGCFICIIISYSFNSRTLQEHIICNIGDSN
jgi:hypothetical protein